MQSLYWTGAVLVAAIAMGCEAPVQHRAVHPTATLQAAVDAGAQKDPLAASYLTLARGDLQEAAIYSGTDRGDRALERAAVDSKVALAVATSNQQRADALAAQAKVKQLEGELCGKETIQ